MPKIGETYERHVVQGSTWQHEVRRIIDVTKRQICYEVIPPEYDGTTTASIPEPDIHQVSPRGWSEWAVLARKVGG